MISVEHITKKFKKLYALDDVSASFHKGQVVSLIGPNGSGKTTLIKSILGIVQPDGGTIRFSGQAISNQYQYRDQIGYMPQIGRYPDNMTIGQVIDMIKNIRNNAGARLDEELLESYNMQALLGKNMRSLSGGTRQKVSAVLAFLFDPDVLILDEPTAGLDPLATEILKDKIMAEKEKGKLILITSHILSDLDELTTDVMYLQDGRLRLYQPIEELKELTGESRLGRAIAAVMKSGYTQLQPTPGAIIKNMEVHYA
ncbi:Cu-processing system ATP-binding protein [Cnuella takakiae]|uniref:Cu-processing system ATP-binding protein n=1 Tax=Cnuella takakiae TaxID=1302690 RepID=A0A1M4X9E3_9BACT|nr:ABC transporter ATP-binding protein [Cnuella takakiae]OLY91494.1 copper ABC transporter ATP-binding protein [Cnuella takakiae]SHE89975.1 Cu-processing system ATP-binding protein [Cnuella takakiae]